MKIKTNKTPIILLLAILLASGCQEEYHPDIDMSARVLVVDGLITDQNGPHVIKLSLAGRFQQEEIANPVTGAMLTISSNDGTEVTLKETSPGNYETPAHFFGRPGYAYVLDIETDDGFQYRSAPQTMRESIAVDSIIGQFGEAVFYNRSSISHRIYQTTIQGTYTYVQTSSGKDKPANYRFVSSIYLQHAVPISDVTVDLCWIKKSHNDFLGTDISTSGHMAGARQVMGFAPYFPNQIKYLGLLDTLLFDNTRVFINKIYTLNDASFAYHKAKNEQINTSGRFFDPIASQPPGNMTCINDPKKMVLGLFEASPEMSFTYRIKTDYVSRQTVVEMINSMDHVPDEGCLRNLYPDFWVY